MMSYYEGVVPGGHSGHSRGATFFVSSECKNLLSNKCHEKGLESSPGIENTTTNAQQNEPDASGGVPGRELGPPKRIFFCRKPAARETPCVHYGPPSSTRVG
jgi:hypothetical protein